MFSRKCIKQSESLLSLILRIPCTLSSETPIMKDIQKPCELVLVNLFHTLGLYLYAELNLKFTLNLSKNISLYPSFSLSCKIADSFSFLILSEQVLFCFKVLSFYSCNSNSYLILPEYSNMIFLRDWAGTKLDGFNVVYC